MMLGRSAVPLALCAVSAAGFALGAEVDRYGGLDPSPGEAKGAFRIGQADGRSFLITPDGGRMIAFGVNHIGAADRYDDERLKDRPTILANLRDWNMNSIGYGGPLDLQRELPYFATITVAPIEKHRSFPDPPHKGGYAFPDVFDPAWAARMDDLFREACEPRRGDPYLIGYLWTDTPTWDLIKTRGLRGTEWVSEIRRLPSSSPGRRRYLAFLRDRYASRLGDLNNIYGLDAESFDDLGSQDFSTIAVGRHVVAEDDGAFLALIAERFYEVVGEAQRRHDPDHLVFGDRYLAGDAPTVVLQAAAPYIDAVAVQPGDRYTRFYPPSTRYPEREMERLHQLTSKPVLICDHTISYPTAEHPRTIFEQAPNAAEAAALTEAFIRRAAESGWVLGYLRCQYIDRPASGGRGLRQGLVDSQGVPRAPLADVYRRVFREWRKAALED